VDVGSPKWKGTLYSLTTVREADKGQSAGCLWMRSGCLMGGFRADIVSWGPLPWAREDQRGLGECNLLLSLV
jgi:hypothetical protein